MAWLPALPYREALLEMLQADGLLLQVFLNLGQILFLAHFVFKVTLAVPHIGVFFRMGKNHGDGRGGGFGLSGEQRPGRSQAGQKREGEEAGGIHGGYGLVKA